MEAQPKPMMTRFYEFLDKPLFFWSRIALALLVIPLAFSLTQPLWRIFMTAPQYPNGLSIDIYTYKIEGGHEGVDLQEINNLNHYIGMHTIKREELPDLDWMPFALGALALLTLRCAAIGKVRTLIDMLVLAGYVFGFSMVRFVYTLWSYGHHLAPGAPVKIPGFTPAIIGTKQIANFTTTSMPQTGTYLAGTFAVGLAVVTFWHLIAGRRAAKQARLAELAVLNGNGHDASGAHVHA